METNKQRITTAGDKDTSPQSAHSYTLNEVFFSFSFFFREEETHKH